MNTQKNTMTIDAQPVSDTKSAILRVALDLFSSRGFEGVGVAELAESAGISKPTLYYYFGSKEGLLREVLEEGFSALDAVLGAAAFYDPHPHSYYEDVYPALCRVVAAYFGFAKDHPTFYRLALSLRYLPPTSPAAALAEPFHSRQYAAVEALFAAISSVHQNMRGRERRFAWNLIGAVNSNVSLWFAGQLELDDHTGADCVRHYMHGIFSG